MKKISIYSLAFIALLFLDRLTKYLALDGFFSKYSYKYLSFDLAINRGVSWGMFHSSSNTVFIIVTLFVVLVMGLLLYHSYNQHKQGSLLVGEILVLSGAFSNLIDRLLYSGVIDFILLSYKSYMWPLFNLADVFIVVGVFVIFLTSKYPSTGSGRAA